MIVRIDADGHVSLDDPDTFTAFHIAAAPGLDAGRISEALGGTASPAPDADHVWIPVERLHALGARHGGPDWRQGCDGMLAYAGKKGWIDDGGERVLAHIETES